MFQTFASEFAVCHFFLLKTWGLILFAFKSSATSQSLISRGWSFTVMKTKTRFEKTFFWKWVRSRVNKYTCLCIKTSSGSEFPLLCRREWKTTNTFIWLRRKKNRKYVTAVTVLTNVCSVVRLDIEFYTSLSRTCASITFKIEELQLSFCQIFLCMMKTNLCILEEKNWQDINLKLRTWKGLGVSVMKVMQYVQPAEAYVWSTWNYTVQQKRDTWRQWTPHGFFLWRTLRDDRQFLFMQRWKDEQLALIIGLIFRRKRWWGGGGLCSEPQILPPSLDVNERKWWRGGVSSH